MENYFFEIEETDRQNDVLVLIIYDIVDNRKRLKLSKYLEGYGNRVQKSAFEAKLSKKKYEKLLREVPAFCAEEDSIRVYKIVGKSQVSAWGTGGYEEQEDVIII